MGRCCSFLHNPFMMFSPGYRGSPVGPPLLEDPPWAQLRPCPEKWVRQIRAGVFFTACCTVHSSSGWVLYFFQVQTSPSLLPNTVKAAHENQPLKRGYIFNKQCRF